MNVNEKVARRFSAILKEWVGREALVLANIKNESWVGTEYESCCASHEFCDANMAMSQAVDEITGLDVDPWDQEIEAQVTPIWNAAWDLAKKNKFYIGA